MSACGPIRCGEMHYPRIPPEYWRHRLRLARAMGLDTVSTYVFWNVHEEIEGTFRFDGWRDIAAFVRTAAEEGLPVILRPGPYVCAEWEFGGFPAWLLRDGPQTLRSADESFMQPVRRWLKALGRELAAVRGLLVAVQLENEYGAFGDDARYLRAMRSALDEAGFAGLPYYTIDQPGDRARGRLEDLPSALTFAPGNCPKPPQLCGEFWAGWFDHWGEPRADVSLQAEIDDLREMRDAGVPFNIYMLHGGTNFGLWNGANAAADGSYQPTTTSYDYQAAIDEAGCPTAKYHAFRTVLLGAQAGALSIAGSPRIGAIAPFDCTFVSGFAAGFEPLAQSAHPRPMEANGVSRGFVAYRTILPHDVQGELWCDARDYTLVLRNGQTLAVLDRRIASAPPQLSLRRGDVLELLVENMGRVNYGPALLDQRKGIVGDVRVGDAVLREWCTSALTHRAPRLRDAGAAASRAPGFFRGVFALDSAADTFVDMSAFEKGVLWVNGRCAGRYWSEGPQQDLYVPAPWLREGENEAVVFDVFASPGTYCLQGRRERAWSLGRPREPSSMRLLKPNAAGANAPGCH